MKRVKVSLDILFLLNNDNSFTESKNDESSKKFLNHWIKRKSWLLIEEELHQTIGEVKGALLEQLELSSFSIYSFDLFLQNHLLLDIQNSKVIRDNDKLKAKIIFSNSNILSTSFQLSDMVTDDTSHKEELQDIEELNSPKLLLDNASLNYLEKNGVEDQDKVYENQIIANSLQIQASEISCIDELSISPKNVESNNSFVAELQTKKRKRRKRTKKSNETLPSDDLQSAPGIISTSGAVDVKNLWQSMSNPVSSSLATDKKLSVTKNDNLDLCKNPSIDQLISPGKAVKEKSQVIQTPSKRNLTSQYTWQPIADYHLLKEHQKVRFQYLQLDDELCCPVISEITEGEIFTIVNDSSSINEYHIKTTKDTELNLKFNEFIDLQAFLLDTSIASLNSKTRKRRRSRNSGSLETDPLNTFQIEEDILDLLNAKKQTLTH